VPQERLSETQIDWNVCSLVSMTHILMDMNPPAYEIKRSPHMGSGEIILRMKVLSDSFFL
jgi:hypothetical protein